MLSYMVSLRHYQCLRLHSINGGIMYDELGRFWEEMYVVNNKHLSTKNLEVHNHNTRSVNNCHLPITTLTKYQKGAYYTGIKTFNYLPTHIKNVVNEIQVFKKTHRDFFLITDFTCILLMTILMLINYIYS